MVGWNLIFLLPIPINKQDLSGIKIYQSRRLWSILIFSSTIHPYKFDYNKRKISIIFNLPLISSFQGCNYSFIYSTKITRQTYHLHESLQPILPSCCCCIFRKFSTLRTWTQSSIHGDFILSWWRRNHSTISTYISSR